MGDSGQTNRGSATVRLALFCVCYWLANRLLISGCSFEVYKLRTTNIRHDTVYAFRMAICCYLALVAGRLCLLGCSAQKLSHRLIANGEQRNVVASKFLIPGFSMPPGFPILR